MFRTILLVVLALCGSSALAKVKTVKIQNLSTMGADIFPSTAGVGTYTHGEWGFAALIEIETDTGQKKQILFDTGAYKETVLGNVKKLGVKFKPEHVVVSHFHTDHTGGLSTLKKKYPRYLNKVHVGNMVLAPRREVDQAGNMGTAEVNSFIAESEKYLDVARKKGARAQIVSYDQTTVLSEVDNDVTLVYRARSPQFSDFNTAGNPYRYLGDDGQYHEDDLPEEMSLVINTKDGLIIISGCAHRGVLNTTDWALSEYKRLNNGKTASVFALVGGFHLLFSDARKLPFEGVDTPYNQVIAEMLKRWGLKLFWGAHCTGHQAVEAVLQLMKNDPNARLSGGFQDTDPLKVIEGRAGQTFTYDGTAIPKVTKGVYR